VKLYENVFISIYRELYLTRVWVLAGDYDKMKAGQRIFKDMNIVVDYRINLSKKVTENKEENRKKQWGT
jgi:hypothetical protein